MDILNSGVVIVNKARWNHENEVNHILISRNLRESLFVGRKSFVRLVEYILKDNRSKNVVLAFDGYFGVDWSVVPKLAQSLEESKQHVSLLDCSDLYKDTHQIWEMIRLNIECDEHFGKVYKGTLKDFIDYNKLNEIEEKVRSFKRHDKGILILFGEGLIAKRLVRLFDYIFFLDLTHEKFLGRVQNQLDRLVPKKYLKTEGSADVGLSLTAFKFSRYIIVPVFDKHRRSMLRKMSYYVLAEEEGVKILSRSLFEEITAELVKKPFKLKPLYIQGPWGGQWIKKLRSLERGYVNCAWAFEAVTMDMGLLLKINDDADLELPFATLLASRRDHIMGRKTSKRFGYFFPIRVHYDDSFRGGNMAIQVHPNRSYAKKYFGENVGQHEAYFIIHASKGTGVYLGLKEGVNVKKFAADAEKSWDEKTPLEYQKYVNFIHSKVGDLFLIPAGTVHALGRNQVCLEIGTSYGYTFHIYDYLRPDLQGNLRDIHLHHAFKALKSSRREKWVSENLLPQPVAVRQQKNSTEYILSSRKGMIFEIRRLDLVNPWQDKTNGKFHILILFKGSLVIIRSDKDRSYHVSLEHSRTVIVPSSMGEYTIEPQGTVSLLKLLTKD